MDGFDVHIETYPDWLKGKTKAYFVLGGFVVGNHTLSDWYRFTTALMKERLQREAVIERVLIDKFPTSVHLARKRKITKDGHTKVLQIALEHVERLKRYIPEVDFLLLDNTTAYMNDNEVISMGRGLGTVLARDALVLAVSYEFGANGEKTSSKDGITRYYRSTQELSELLIRSGLNVTDRLIYPVRYKVNTAHITVATFLGKT